MTAQREGKILLTGASGYVGGRLLKALEKKNLPVRCLARHPESLKNQVSGKTEVVGGDVLAAESLLPALAGIHTAYYLIHALGVGAGFELQEQAGAKNFAAAAQRAGLEKIIYLGGLGESEKPLSPHLRSRQEVGQILRDSGIPVLEFRASIILGSGSLSFEMVRALVERLPVMTTPKWVRTPTQPIAIENVISYLLLALDFPLPESRIFEIGGADVVSYGGIMNEYARQRGLKRWMIPVPVLSPGLSSLWLKLVTPLYARVGRKLIEGIRNPTLVRNPVALREFPVRPMGIREAIAGTLAQEDQEFVRTRWSDLLPGTGARHAFGGVRFKNRRVDSRTLQVSAPPERAFAPIQRIGGKNGWYFANWLWRLRGWLDQWLGGVGLRRGRSDPVALKTGDALDFWRVEDFDPPKKLLLRAEMKLPGRAWLEFEVEPAAQGALIRQTAIFDPKGLGGRCYWYLLYPLHLLIFRGMVKKIGEKIPGS